MESCIYEGTVSHRRRSPVEHAFSFPLYMFHLDLDDGLHYGRFGAAGTEPAARITVLDPRFYSSIALRGAIGAGEAYMDGWFEATT